MITSPWSRENVLLVRDVRGWYELIDTTETCDTYPVALRTGVSFSSLAAGLEFIERLPLVVP